MTPGLTKAADRWPDVSWQALLEGDILKSTKLSVIVWNEFIRERRDPAARSIYPEGVHRVIARALQCTAGFGASAATLEVTTATLDQAEHGLSEARLEACDVLIWWGDLAHDAVADAVVKRIHRRVLEGMGIIVLHAGSSSKIGRRLLGAACPPNGNTGDEPPRLWVAQASHPIAAGLGELCAAPGEAPNDASADPAQPDSTVFLSGVAGGQTFRSGCCWERGYGRLFHFQPGPISRPTFHDADVQRVLANAVQWAAPRFRFADAEPSAQESRPGEAKNLHSLVHGGDQRNAASRTREAKATQAHWHLDPTPLFPTLIKLLEQGEPKAKRQKNGSGRFAHEFESTASRRQPAEPCFNAE